MRIGAIRLFCPDPVSTAAFYRVAFGCEIEQTPSGILVRLGDQVLELVATTPSVTSPAPSNATDFQHCAIIVSDMESAYARLRSVANWTPISENGPEHLPASSGGATAFKFRDPDGHPLELLAFPPDSVPTPWLNKAGLFLGIDHTAITVADTERSVAFYAGLGFTVATRGLNRGEEQARMDGVTSPVVEVTGLTPPGGAPPHLELLCYREPGVIHRPVENSAVSASRIVLLAGDVDEGEERDVRDPDGHRLVIRGL